MPRTILLNLLEHVCLAEGIDSACAIFIVPKDALLVHKRCLVRCIEDRRTTGGHDRCLGAVSGAKVLEAFL